MSLTNYQRYALKCPHCGGPVFRTITFRERLLAFVPVHLLFRGHFRCESCGAVYSGRSFYGDLLLLALFVSSELLVPDPWLVAGLLIIIWTGFSIWIHLQKITGPIHVYVGFLLVSFVWMLALAGIAANTRERDHLLNDFGGMIFGILAVVFVGLADFLLYLDRRFPPELTPQA